MKNFEHPEFLILHKIQQLQEKYPDFKELSELDADVRNIINENVLSLTQYAHLYALMGKKGDISPEMREKLVAMLECAAEICRKG